MSEWLSIDTAPKGVYVIVWEPFGGMVVAMTYDDDLPGSFWVLNGGGHDPDSINPTHWMPLPDPPQP